MQLDLFALSIQVCMNTTIHSHCTLVVASFAISMTDVVSILVGINVHFFSSLSEES